MDACECSKRLGICVHVCAHALITKFSCSSHLSTSAASDDVIQFFGVVEPELETWRRRTHTEREEHQNATLVDAEGGHTDGSIAICRRSHSPQRGGGVAL